MYHSRCVCTTAVTVVRKNESVGATQASYLALLIAIAQITTKCVHHGPENWVGGANEAERKLVAKLHRRAIWDAAAKSASALDDLLTVVDVKVLPDGPYSDKTSQYMLDEAAKIVLTCRPARGASRTTGQLARSGSPSWNHQSASGHHHVHQTCQCRCCNPVDAIGSPRGKCSPKRFQ